MDDVIYLPTPYNIYLIYCYSIYDYIVFSRRVSNGVTIYIYIIYIIYIIV